MEPIQQPKPIPAELMSSFEQNFNALKLDEHLPMRLVWDLKNVYLAAIGLAYELGRKDR